MLSLAKEIIAGKRLGRDFDGSIFIDCDLEELSKGANEIRAALCGNKIDLCTIVNGRAGHCSEDCKFCAQSSFHKTACNQYDMLSTEEFIADCRGHYEEGVHAYSIVTAGRSVAGRDLDQMCNAIEALKATYPEMRFCASSGFLTRDGLLRLKEAGITTYHENLETSKANFPNICTTHTYDDKLRELAMAKEIGLQVCSGGIIGMGEAWEDRIDMAVSLSEIGVFSIPINALIPVKGTAFESLTPITEDEILRSVCIFRYYNPEAYIRMAAGRNYFKDGGTRLFLSGANATITGNMLTTVGNNTAMDKEMFTSLGFDISRR